MPKRRKKRGGPPSGIPSYSGARIQRDAALLDAFSHTDLRTWERVSRLLREFRVKQYYHLEGLREIHKVELASAIKNQTPVAIEVKGWVRIVDWKYSLEPLSAQGSFLSGGRFNIGKSLNPSAFPPFPSLYIAEDYETAYSEKFGDITSEEDDLSASELALRTPDSFTSICVNGELSGLLDIRSSDALEEFSRVISKFSLTPELIRMARELGLRTPYLLTTSDDLLKALMRSWREWEMVFDLPSNSQIFAKIVQDCGFEGILYRSTKSDGDCIALFLQNFDSSPSFIEVADPAPAARVIKRLDGTTWDQLYQH